MDSPPKKWHLTHQFLMEVTRKEGLSWGADLVTHVSEVFWIFDFSQLPLILSLTLEENLGMAKLLEDFLSRWTLLPYQITSVHLISLFPKESPPPRITWLEALWELWAWERNPMPDKVCVDSWLLLPQYIGNFWSLDEIPNSCFPKLRSWCYLSGFQMASGS